MIVLFLKFQRSLWRQTETIEIFFFLGFFFLRLGFSFATVSVNRKGYLDIVRLIYIMFWQFCLEFLWRKTSVQKVLIKLALLEKYDKTKKENYKNIFSSSSIILNNLFYEKCFAIKKYLLLKTSDIRKKVSFFIHVRMYCKINKNKNCCFSLYWTNLSSWMNSKWYRRGNTTET